MPLVAGLRAAIDYKYTGTPDLGFNLAQYDGHERKELATGTAAQQVDKLFSDTRTLAASATEDLDLAGTLTDPFGVTCVFAKVKGILIKANAGNTNNVVVGAAAATQFIGPFGAATHTIAIPPGGEFMITAPANGWAVGAGTTDLLKIANSGAGTSVTYDIIIIGTSA